MRVYQSIIACGRVVPAFAALLAVCSVLVAVYPQVATAGSSDPLSIQSLDHAPASFDVEVQFNGSSTETLTLFNNGTTNLDFTVRASRDELSVVVLSPDQNPPTGIVTDLNAFPGITAELYTGDLNELTGADLIPYDVAILNNEESWGWPDGNVIVGDALADFIDANGKAVVFNNSYASEAYGSHLDGRFITENYGPVQRSPDNAVLLFADMDVEESGHPILSGVGTVKSTGGRVFDNPVQPGATVVAIWGFSRSAISANDDVVAFNMFYPDFAEGDFSGDIELMTYNAVMFFELMGWLDFGTESGTVPAGGQVDIDVHFDAAGLAGGVYEGDIVVEAGSGSLIIPATLTVVDQRPWLEGTVTSLGFCSLNPHPLEGAQIEIVGSQSGSYQATTDADGFYRLRIEAAESPLAISVSAANHEGFHATGLYLPPQGGTAIADFELVMDGCASHTPQSFDIELLAGESGTETLTLYNSGDTTLDFSLAANSPQVSVVVLTADWPMPTNLVADLNSFPGISAEMYPGNLTNLDVITGADLAGYDVAVLNNTGSWAYYGGNISVGNALADFVDAGGKVVVFNGSYVNQGDDSRLDGRFMDEDYGPFLPISGPWSGSWNMVPLEPDHTILGGVGAVGTSHWILYVSMQPGAELIAEWDNGRPMIAANEDVVAINLYYSYLDQPTSWTGNVDRLAYNAVMHFQSVGWLNLDPENGTVPVGETFNIDVHFDSDGLDVGVYQANLLLDLSDSLGPVGTVTVPVSLTVAEPATIAGTVTSLGYCSDDPSALEGAQIEVEGSQSGSWSVISGPGGAYQLEISATESPVTVSVTAADHLEASETGVALAAGTTTTVDLELMLGAGCTSHNPQDFAVELFAGQTATEVLTLANTGFAASGFDVLSVETTLAGTTTISHIIERPAVAARSVAGDERSRASGDFPARAAQSREVTLGLRQDDLSVVVISPDVTAPTNLVGDLNGFPGLSADLYPRDDLSTITGADLAGYDVAVLTNNNQWQIAGANISVGDALADFIDAGGKAVVFNYAYDDPTWGFQLDGRFITDGYGPFLPAINEAFSGSTMVMLDPDHPILDGVTSLTNGALAPRLNNPLQPGATLIAEWADGFPLIAFDDNVVAVNALYSSNGNPGDWNGDLDLIAYNAVKFIADYKEPPADWLSFDPESGTVAVSDESVIDVHFDATGLTAGVHQADILVQMDEGAGVSRTLTLPASLTVVDPAIVAGTVTSLGYCSDDLSMLEGAQVELVSQSGSYSTVTGPGGSYQFEIDAAESPVTISVTATDHLGDSESGVALVPFDTVVVDFDLALDAACATVAPDDVAFTLYPGESDAASLEIGNVNGAGVLDWTVFSAEIMASDPRAHFPAVPYVAEPADRSDSSAAASAGRTSLHGPDEAGGLLDATVPVYTTTSWDAPGYITLDALVPGPYTVINATQPARVYAAAFIDNDFSTHYGVVNTLSDLPLNSFIAIDTATGAFETLGTVSDGPADGINSMKWDHTTSTLYAASRDSLYTIDPDTFQADLVGPFGPAGTLVVAIAISPEGLMYALDIASDALLAVDKTTGEAAAIGSLGLDANYAQDMDFDPTDGTLYWGSYLRNFDSEVRVIDPATGASTSLGHIQGGTELMSFSIALPGQTGCFSAVDIEWLEVAPVSGSTAAGSSDLVTVSVNASGLAPGLYEADVCVSTNDPVHSLMTVPVSLLVEVPPAVVSGTVRGLGYCSADPAGLAGALVEAQGSDGGSFSVTTDGSGFYQFEVFAEDSPLTISTGFDGHNDASITVEFEPGEQVNGDLDLLLSIPCAAVLPESLSINLDAGSSLTGQIEVSNATGGAPLVWNIDSAEVSGDDDAVRLVQCDDPEGFSWLKFSPMFGVTPAGTASHINVTLDAGSLQPGQYQAGLCIASNDAHHTLQSVPINLNVRTPGTWGDGLDGTVQSLGYCGDNPAPLEGATVTVVGTGFSEPTDADGYFSFALDPDQGPYELTVTHPDHLPASESGINPPATVDFDLALDAACATVDPEAIVGSALTGGTDLQTLTISNHGAADLNWTIDEALPAALPPTQLQLSMGLPATGSYTLLGGMASGRVDTGNLLDLGPFQMSQTTDTNIEPANSVGCPTGPNHLLRRFYYDEHPGVGNGIESVDVAVQEAADTTSLTVNLYTLASSTPVDTIPVGDLVLIGTAMASISAGDDGTIVNVPVIGVVDDMSANDLVVEVVANQSFFVGATSSGETHPGFVMASACGITSPTPVRDVGPDFVNTHIIMVVNATPGSGCTAPEDVPWLSTSPTSGTVAGGDSATVDVMLDASNLSPGVYEAELCVNSNDAANPLIPVPVSLEVLDLDPAELGVDPAALDFGTVPVGDEVTQSFSVSNRAEVGSAALVLTGLDVSGDAGFSLSGGDCALNTELEPGDSCLVEISFTPGAEAVFEAEVTIAANAQQATVALSGTGHAEPSADLIFSDRFEEVDADDEG